MLRRNHAVLFRRTMLTKVVAILAVVSVVSATAGPGDEDVKKALRSNRRFVNLLKSNLAKFHKHYSSSELSVRARFFRKNLVDVEDCNAHSAFHCGVNEFSTMTDGEKQQHLGLGNFTNMPDSPIDNSFRLMSVSSIDWRQRNTVTAVKNQKGCGSCWAFAAIASIEGTYAITTGKLRTFSDQEILECTYEHYSGYNGCHGGWMYDAFTYLKENQHLASQSDRPYQEHDGACRTGTRNAGAAVEFTGYLKTKGGDQDLANALAITPTTVAMLAKDTFFIYSDGEYDGYADCSGATFPNHALTAVGFTRNVFIVKNSWGPEWGDKGYINVARYRNVCFINKFAYYSTMKKIGEDTGPTDRPTDAPSPVDKCEDPKREDNCIDENSTGCPTLRRDNRCFESSVMYDYVKQYCKYSCGFCNNIPLSDIDHNCRDRIEKYTCKDKMTAAACPKSCCADGSDDGSDCPSGTVRCSDGVCKHIHMC